MPTRTMQVRLPFAHTAGPASLPYQLSAFPGEFVKANAGRQSRLQNRLLVEPTIDLMRYRCSAEVDLIDIGLATADIHQALNLSSMLQPVLGRRPYVCGPERQERYIGNEFIVRIQNPTRGLVGAVCRAVDTIRSDGQGEGWNLRAVPRIRKIEISVDFRPRSVSPEERLQMVGLLQRHFLPNWSVVKECKRSPPRCLIGGRRRNGRDRVHRVIQEHRDRPPFVDGTYFVGPKAGIATWRIMDKTTDQRYGSHWRKLPKEECRARIEVTLQDEVLEVMGLTEPDDLGTYRFGRLASLAFPFKVATVPAGEEPEEQEERHRLLRRFRPAGVYGVHDEERKTNVAGRRGRRENGTLVSWPKLNSMAKRALEHMGDRW